LLIISYIKICKAIQGVLQATPKCLLFVVGNNIHDESHTNENKKKKDRKQTYNSRFDIIEHKLIGEVECILGAKQTKHLGKQYFIK
jgi:hypothetical protein